MSNIVLTSPYIIIIYPPLDRLRHLQAASVATINNEAFCRNKNTRPDSAVSNNKRGKLMKPVGGRVQRERAC